MEGPAGYSPNSVVSVHAAPDGGIGAGTWGGGAGRCDGAKWVNFTDKDGLAGNIVYSIAQDQAGAMWFGTNKGLSRFDGKAWKNFTRKDGLIDDNVYALAVTPSGDVWAGSRGGVVRLGKK